MSNKREAKGFFNRIISSVFGVVLGIGLFLGSFFVLWLNEGRVDLSKIAAKSTSVSSAVAANNGRLVDVSGQLHSSETLGDPSFIRSGNYLRLDRQVEIYERREQQDEDGNTEYKEEWTSSLPSDAPLRADSFQVSSAQIASYTLDGSQLFFMDPQPLTLTREIVAGNVVVQENYIYRGAGTLTNPQLGDIRIAYTAFPNDVNGTAFGKQVGNQLLPYQEEDVVLYRAYAGNRAEAIQDMRGEYLLNLWLTRLGGFMMMWFGMAMILQPITTLLGILPVAGRLSRRLIGLITFVVAAFLSLITIIVSAIVHSLLALIIVLVLLVGGVLLWQRWGGGGGKTAVAV